MSLYTLYYYNDTVFCKLFLLANQVEGVLKRVSGAVEEKRLCCQRRLVADWEGAWLFAPSVYM